MNINFLIMVFIVGAGIILNILYTNKRVADLEKGIVAVHGEQIVNYIFEPVETSNSTSSTSRSFRSSTRDNISFEREYSSGDKNVIMVLTDRATSAVHLFGLSYTVDNKSFSGSTPYRSNKKWYMLKDISEDSVRIKLEWKE